MTFEELAAAVKAYDSSLDEAWLQRVYSTAVEAHEGQRRASGESYVEHPLAVAGILAELEMDRQTIGVDQRIRVLRSNRGRSLNRTLILLRLKPATAVRTK